MQALSTHAPVTNMVTQLNLGGPVSDNELLAIEIKSILLMLNDAYDRSCVVNVTSTSIQIQVENLLIDIDDILSLLNNTLLLNLGSLIWNTGAYMLAPKKGAHGFTFDLEKQSDEISLSHELLFKVNNPLDSFWIAKLSNYLNDL